jgi:hypothetical protein
MNDQKKEPTQKPNQKQKVKFGEAENVADPVM